MKRQKAALATRLWAGTSSACGNTTPIMVVFISQYNTPQKLDR